MSKTKMFSLQNFFGNGKVSATSSMKMTHEMKWPMKWNAAWHVKSADISFHFGNHFALDLRPKNSRLSKIRKSWGNLARFVE